ncbi:MAG: serine/threonine protein kinase [Planctomycetaceae bacterium]|nr:serine/threonine protein kinase [Planctomycetaceae bacterium]
MTDHDRQSSKAGESDETVRDAQWDAIAVCIESFQQAWDEGQIPDVRDYIELVPNDYQYPALIELVKLDLENRWAAGLRRLVEDYADDFPELTEIPDELIFEEYHVRRSHGDKVTADEICERFPSQRSRLLSVLAVTPSLAKSLQDRLEGGAWKTVYPGQQIGDFELLLELGAGAFAKVFYARQRSMQRLVALKVSADRGAEGMTLAQLDHEHIVRVYDQLRMPEKELRLLYMQFVAGGTLQNIIQNMRHYSRAEWNGRLFLSIIDQVVMDRGGTSPEASDLRHQIEEMSWSHLVCWIGARLASALEYAHRQRVLHRDLKPANILLTAEGSPRLADFNISFGAGLEGVSVTDHFGGSLAYMPPEQLRAVDPGTNVDATAVNARSDIYSLGVVLWELLTGERPFIDPQAKSGTIEQLKEMIETRQRGPRLFRGQIPGLEETRGLSSVLKLCLSFEPEQRPGDALEVERELQLCMDPEAQELLSFSSRGVGKLACRFPVLVVILATVIPNGVGAFFNFHYNRDEIIDQIPESLDAFMRLQTVINAVTFPLGIFLGVRLIRSVVRIVGGDRREQPDTDALVIRRRDCLNLGRVVTALSLTLWLVAAPVYPICLHIMRGQVPVSIYGHFLTSLAVCGLIASAYPFLFVSVIAVRFYYPSLMRWDSFQRDDVRNLHLLGQASWMALALAALVPMIGTALMTLFSEGHHASTLALTVGGATGFGLAVPLFRRLHRDIDILVRTINAVR